MVVMIQGKNYEAKVTTEHPTNSYRIPVLVLGPGSADVIVYEERPDVVVLDEGTAIGTIDAEVLGVRLVQASVPELEAFRRAGYPVRWACES